MTQGYNARLNESLGSRHKGSHSQSLKDKIAKKGGYSKKAAGAILASASRNASASAKRKNPKLNKVKGRSKR